MRNQLVHYLRSLASRIEKKSKPSAIPTRVRIVTVPAEEGGWRAYSPECWHVPGVHEPTQEAALTEMENQLAARGCI